MIQLPKEKKIDGCLWRLVVRDGRWAIYEQIIGPETSNWQVFKVNQAKEGEIKGRKTHARELFPSPSQYGVYAWNFQTREKAYERFHEKIAKDRKPSGK